MTNPTTTLQQILKFCQLILALLWFYQGLVPKLIFQVADEQYVWQQFNVPLAHIGGLISFSGIAEMIFGSLFLFITHKYLHYLSIFSLIGLFMFVLFIYPDHIYQAFNPVVMNSAMISLSVIALCCIAALQNTKPE